MAIVHSSAEHTQEPSEQQQPTEPPSEEQNQIQLAPAPPMQSPSPSHTPNTFIPSIASSNVHGGPQPVFSNPPPQPPPMQSVPLPPSQNPNPNQSPETEISKIHHVLNELLEQLSANRQASIRLHSLAAGVKVRAMSKSFKELSINCVTSESGDSFSVWLCS